MDNKIQQIEFHGRNSRIPAARRPNITDFPCFYNFMSAPPLKKGAQIIHNRFICSGLRNEGLHCLIKISLHTYICYRNQSSSRIYKLAYFVHLISSKICAHSILIIRLNIRCLIRGFRRSVFTFIHLTRFAIHLKVA